jgi:predicted Zn-dependent protease
MSRRKALLRRIGLATALAGATAIASAAEPADGTMTALEAELTRAMELALPGLEKPYFAAIRLVDLQTFQTSAALGEIVSEPEMVRQRWVRPEIRVGSWQTDAVGGGPRLTVLDDVGGLRHDVWLANDEAYKAAVASLARKRATLKNRVETDPAADFTQEEPVKDVLPARQTALDGGRWRAEVRKLSALFRDFPAIQESSVDLQVTAGSRYLLTSEGTRLRLPGGLAILSIQASTQASDGAPVRQSVVSLAKRLEDLPDEAELSATVRRVAEKLTALASAPTVESYTGPVLFTGQASAMLFAQVLLPQLSDRRPAIATEQTRRNDLGDKIGRPVLPAFLSVVDDPTQVSFEGKHLVGTYAYDDEGVKARPVTLVENGVLKALLMSRRPSKEIQKSNGHGRGQIQSGYSVSASNVFVKVTGDKPTADPKAELLRICKGQGLAFGILVKTLPSPLGGGGGGSLTPLEAYRVFPDGREELVRGLIPGEVNMRTLKDIVAAGNDTYVGSRLFTQGASSIVAPSVLVEEMEFRRESGSRQALPLLASPISLVKASAH